MKILKLTPEFRDVLIDLPETGMGYQKVTVTLKNGITVPNKIVVNCDHMVIDEIDNFTVNDILFLILDLRK